MAGPIEMPFAERTRVGPRNRVLGCTLKPSGEYDGSIWTAATIWAVAVTTEATSNYSTCYVCAPQIQALRLTVERVIKCLYIAYVSNSDIY